MQSQITFPQTRLRRLRQKAFTRRLTQETTLSVDDLIYPIFITDGINTKTTISAMPDCTRLSIDLLIEEAQKFYSRKEDQYSS